MCKHKLKQTTFCTCPNLNRNMLSSLKLLPSKQRNTIFFVYGCTNASLNKFPFARGCYPQTKKQHCSICSARGQKLEIRAVCLAWCTNVECACTPPEAELQRSADENIRGHKHCILHSARDSVRHSTRPQNAVNTTFSQKLSENTKKENISIVFVNCQ